MFAYDGQTDLLAQYHDRSGYAKSPEYFPIYTEDSMERVLVKIKDGTSRYPEKILKVIEEYFPNNVSISLGRARVAKYRVFG